jgi:hypothetical protein
VVTLPYHLGNLGLCSPRINEKQRKENYPPHVNFAARAGLAALPGTSDIRLVHLFFMANVGINLGGVAEGWVP